jgi:hypothetical protein
MDIGHEIDKTAELLTVARQPMILTWFPFNQTGDQVFRTRSNRNSESKN